MLQTHQYFKCTFVSMIAYQIPTGIKDVLLFGNFF